MDSKVAYALMLICLLIGVGIGWAAKPTPKAPTGGGAPTKAQCPKCPTGLSGEVPIGALLSLTGALSNYGENSEVALKLAEKQINEWLASIGEKWRIKVYYEDTATDPKTALDKIQALYGKGVKIFIGPMTSAEVSTVKNYADANKLLVISQSSTSPALSISDDMVFRYCPDDTIQGPAAAHTAFQLGVRHLVVVWRGDTWGDGLAETTIEAFNKLVKEKGVQGEAIKGIRYDPNAKEFSTEAAKLNQIVSDLVQKYGKDEVGVSFIGFTEYVAFAAAASQYPVLSEVLWIGSDGTADTPQIVQNPSIAEFAIKTRFLNPIFAPSSSPFLDEVKSYVKQKLGREPDSYAYAAYDALWTAAIALEMTKSYDPVTIAKILPSVVKRYMGASGNFQLNKYGDRAFSDYFLRVVVKKNGKYTWDTAGVYRCSTGVVEFSSWFKP